MKRSAPRRLPTLLSAAAIICAAGLLGGALWSCGSMQETASTPETNNAQCGTEGSLVLQVLGSGGPIADDARASSGYLIWQDGRARVLVEAGGGVFLRFGESGAQLADLDAIAITHLHADHVGALPALLKSGYFAQRQRPLPLLGPSGNDRFPAMDVFVDALLNKESGAFAYLSGYQDGSLFPLPVSTLDATAEAPATAFKNERIQIESVGVHHGSIPAVGYVVTIGGMRLAFAGDQSADNAPFQALAKYADVMVMHHAIPVGADNLAHLHATPSQMGEAAATAEVKRLVLAHHMQRALNRSDESVEAIRQSYGGPVELSDDLSCFVLKP